MRCAHPPTNNIDHQPLPAAEKNMETDTANVKDDGSLGMRVCSRRLVGQRHCMVWSVYAIAALRA